MGEIRQVFTADIGDLENKLAKLQAAHLQLKEKLQDYTRSTKASGDVLSDWAGTQQKQFSSLIASYTTGAVSITAAIGLIKSAYGEWNKMVDETREKNKQISKDIMGGMARGGLLGHAHEARQWAEQTVRGEQLNGPVPLGNTIATREQLLSGYQGALAGAPAMGESHRRAIALRASLLAPVDDEKGGMIGKMSQQMAALGEFLPVSADPKAAAAKLASVTTRLQQQLGPQDAEQILSRQFLGGVRAFQESGAGTAEEAMALGVQAIRKQMSPQIVERLAAKVATGVPVEHKRGARATPKERMLESFNAAAPRERYQMLLENEELQGNVLGEKLQGRLGRIDQYQVDVEAAGLTYRPDADYFTRELASAASDKGYQKAFAAQALRARSDRADFTTVDTSGASQRAADEKRRQVEYKEGKRSYGSMKFEGSADSLMSFREWGRDALGIEKLNKNIETNQATNAATNARTNGNE